MVMVVAWIEFAMAATPSIAVEEVLIALPKLAWERQAEIRCAKGYWLPGELTGS